MSIWDDPDLQVAGNYVQFENVGDSVSGVINLIRPHRFDDGSTAAQLFITTDNGEEVTVTAGQIRLKAELARLRPEPGDRILIRYSQKEARQGGKTLKHFEVQVQPGRGGQPQQPQYQQPQQFQQAPQQYQQPQGQPAFQQPQGQPPAQWQQQWEPQGQSQQPAFQQPQGQPQYQQPQQAAPQQPQGQAPFEPPF